MTQAKSQTEAFRVGTAEAQPGTIARGIIPTDIGMDGTMGGVPVLICHGARPGPRLWLNAAIHGDEPEGTLGIFRLFEALDPAQVCGTVVAIPAQNPGAFSRGERGNPDDTFTYDMNRNYPGKADGRLSERIANAHWVEMKDKVDMQVSLHSGGQTCFLSHMIFAPDNDGCRELAAAMGPRWSLVFTSSVKGGTPNAALTNHAQVPTITVELGGNCRTLTNDLHDIVDEYLESFLNVLRHYGMIEGTAEYAPEWRIGRQNALLAPVSGIFVGAKDLPLETIVPKGTLIGTIYSLFGDVAAEILAPEDGLIFGLRSRPAVMTGEWCCFFGVVDGSRKGFQQTRK